MKANPELNYAQQRAVDLARTGRRLPLPTPEPEPAVIDWGDRNSKPYAEMCAQELRAAKQGVIAFAKSLRKPKRKPEPKADSNMGFYVSVLKPLVHGKLIRVAEADGIIQMLIRRDYKAIYGSYLPCIRREDSFKHDFLLEAFREIAGIPKQAQTAPAA